MKILVKNGTIINAAGRQMADILVEDGKIAALAENLRLDDATTINARSCYIFPGFIDTHTHFDLDLGTAITADNFETGTKAALLGGTTTILDFATQDRGGTMHQALEIWHKKAANSSCNYGFHMAVSEWSEALSNEMATMAKEGVTSYKLYMVYPALRVDDGALYRALQRGQELGALIGVHCENFDLLSAMIAEQKAAGNLGPAAHPLSRPAEMEAEAISRFFRLAQMAGAPAYVVHLSTGEGLLEARHARARGQEIYLETCPQYLVLDDARYYDDDAAKFIMSPPLRKPADNTRLWEGLSQDEIQTVGTDHCSFTMAQKALGKDDFTKIPNGSAGVQTRAALYYTYGVCKEHVTLEQMAAQLSENAAKLFGMYPQKGLIAPGSDADLVVWDPSFKGTISQANLAHHCDNTPYEGMAVQGHARDVLLGGEWAVRQGRLEAPGAGKYVPRGAYQKP